MEREVFTQRFLAASARARDFARGFVEESLPDAMLFRVRLNASYDGPPLRENERVFPEDDAHVVAKGLSRCRSAEVVDALWRDGMVPEWVDVSVIGAFEDATLVEVLACDRFTANEQLLYDQDEGLAPFHVLGPSLPPHHEPGRKFSVYDSSECWSGEELDLLVRHAAKVRFLRLSGADFDDHRLVSLPLFEQLSGLDLEASPLHGPGLLGCSRQPRLSHVRLALAHGGAFNAAPLPRLPGLQSFAIENAPAGPWGFSGIASQPTLEALSVSTDQHLVLDARLRGAFRSITLRAASIEGDPLPEKVGSLHVHLGRARDADIERLLARVTDVAQLSLRGTPVSSALIEAIVTRWKLERLDVVDTSVDEDCVRRIRARYPGLRTRPNLDRRRADGS